MINADQCPFGRDLQRYWDRRYDYFSRFSDGIKVDSEGLHTVMPEQAALQLAKLVPDSAIVLDGFCGVGGISIGMARSGKKVIAVDKNAERIEMARHNASIYDVENQITFLCGDFFSVIANIRADVLVLDPPWGWPRYQDISTFQLKHMQPDGNTLLQIALQYFNTILLRVPTIFDLTELGRFNINYVKHDDMLNDEVISATVLIRAL